MKKNVKAIEFFKKNGVYFILVFCLVAIGLSVTLALTKNNSKVVETSGQDTEINQPVIPEQSEEEVVLIFTMPVLNAEYIEEYSDNLVYNTTLKRYDSHKAVDFFAQEGTDVLSVSDGIVESVDSSLLDGVTVTINHGDGIVSVYNSLADADEVFVGQRVNKGEKIGEVSVTNRKEYKDGAHLHFYMLEDGNVINPDKYLTFPLK